MRFIFALVDWNKQLIYNKDVLILISSCIGGWAFSYTHLSVSWMLGALVVSGIFRIFYPMLVSQTNAMDGIHPFWRQLGQMLLAIQIAKQLNIATFHAFERSWSSIFLLLSVSIVFSFVSGMILWKFTQTDLISCLYGTTPGGLSAMPSIASEVGANTVVVTVTQVIRNLCVITFIPIITTTLHQRSSFHLSVYPHRAGIVHSMNSSNPIPLLLWTIVLVLAAYAGYRIWRTCLLPAPALVGSMIGAATIQGLSQWITNVPLVPYWPDWLMILSQIAIGASIGSRIDRNMFFGSPRVMWVSGLCSLIYIWIMTACSIALANWIGVSKTTTILAFAPGGVAEMTLTAAGVHADAPLVLAVQTLRLCIVMVLLPPLFRSLSHRLTV